MADLRDDYSVVCLAVSSVALTDNEMADLKADKSVPQLVDLLVD